MMLTATRFSAAACCSGVTPGVPLRSIGFVGSYCSEVPPAAGAVVVSVVAAPWVCPSVEHWSVRWLTDGAALPAPTPSSAENTPHARGTIHTWTIGFSPPVCTPRAHLPFASVSPTTLGLPSAPMPQHRLLCTCHVISGPAQSVSVGSSAGRALAMYIAPDS